MNIAPTTSLPSAALRRREPQTVSRYRYKRLLPYDCSTGSYLTLTMLTAHCAYTLTALTARSLRCDHSGPAGGMVSLRKISTTGSLPQLSSRGRDMLTTLTALTALSDALTELRRKATTG